MADESTSSGKNTPDGSPNSDQSYDYFEVTMNVDTKKTSISLQNNSESSQVSTPSPTTSQELDTASVRSSHSKSSSDESVLKRKEQKMEENDDHVAKFRDTVINGAMNTEPSRKTSSQSVENQAGVVSNGDSRVRRKGEVFDMPNQNVVFANSPNGVVPMQVQQSPDSPGMMTLVPINQVPTNMRKQRPPTLNRSVSSGNLIPVIFEHG